MGITIFVKRKLRMTRKFLKVFLAALMSVLVILLLAGCSAKELDLTQQGTIAAEATVIAETLSLDRAFINVTYGTTTTVTASYQAESGKTLKFTVDNDAVVHLRQERDACYLTAVGFGKAKLTATYGTESVSVDVVVRLEESKIHVAHEASLKEDNGNFSVLLNKSLDMKAILKYGTTTLEDAVISYAVEDERIGSIDQNTGIFTPAKYGSTVVTVTATWCEAQDTEFIAEFWVTVVENLEDALTDFIVEVPSGRDIVILQLTDTQIIDPGQSRYADRIGSTTKLTDADLENKLFGTIRRLVQETNPDLIIITGDIVYGEFDDSGEILQKFVAFMDSFDIPWAPIFGNHDNESTRGVTWQCQQFSNAKNGLFRRGNVTGNGNYTVGIKQDGKLVRVIYMMDSNGCKNAYSYSYNAAFPSYNQGENVRTTAGFAPDQIHWLVESAEMIDEAVGYSVPKLLACHIPMKEFAMAAYYAGYQSSSVSSNTDTYIIGETVPAQNGDFGEKQETISGCYHAEGLWEALQTYSFDGVFVGHDHKNNMSILYEGVRFTYGLKTGKFDYHDDIGGTKITISAGGKSLTVEHIYDK